MIDPKELRIGNLVYTQSRKMVKGLYEITILKVVTPQEAQKWQPIAITPEWLERMGFKKFTYGDNMEGFIHRWVRGFLNPDNAFCLLRHEDRHAPIKYVHQLQNLYFALTGEEIKIKELA